MKLIIGLGNPGQVYKNNRHNIGHLVVEELLKRKIPSDFIVKKADVFMNDSGDFVKKLVDQYKTNLPDLWIIHDDLDIRLGDYKIQFAKGPKDHHGILSIEEKLGTKDFWRVRIGIDNRGEPFDSAQGKEYVLQDFSGQELELVKKTIKEITKELYERIQRV